MKNFINEFKAFVVRGNVLDLAVAVIIGGAFQKIISSMVNDMIMPIVTLCTGGIDFTNWFIALNGEHYATLAKAQEAGASTINYGVFLTEVISFIIMAFVIFLMVKTMNHLASLNKKEEVQVVSTKVCPYCKSEIDKGASRCPHCTSQLENKEE
ncbi:MAG: large conductance mechanosensitive channel protein MscL [Erysipelotrichia bacterium]|nr:large conductance mechanosensitive channel protein MscL [Erysipelotrichia bacterium]NCC54552.1 large conductance mechanosensitive channel protein MscL [Erysipelotrichia bacterium]